MGIWHPLFIWPMPAGRPAPAAAAQTTAGLQKWVFDGTQWKLAYTLQAGLDLGQPYTVRGYPAGLNTATGLPWAPATDGLRNITGRVNRNGTATIWAVTSTVSGGGDQGAGPEQASSDHRPAGRDQLGLRGELQHRTRGQVRRGAPRGLVHPGAVALAR